MLISPNVRDGLQSAMPRLRSTSFKRYVVSRMCQFASGETSWSGGTADLNSSFADQSYPGPSVDRDPCFPRAEALDVVWTSAPES